MPILPSLLALLAIFPSVHAGVINEGASRVERQADSAATAAANEGLSLLQIFQDQSISRAGIKQRVSSWASGNQFADLVADFENSVRQRTLARREQAKEAAVELPKALDTIAEIEDDMLLTPSETYTKVDQTLHQFSPKLRSLVLTAMEPTPLDNSKSTGAQRDDIRRESSGDLPVEVVEGSGAEGSGVDVEGSGIEGSGVEVEGSRVEGSGMSADEALRLYIEGSGSETSNASQVEGSGITQRPLELRSLPPRSTPKTIVEGSGVGGSGLEGSGEVEGSGIAPSLLVFPMLQLRDVPVTSTDGSLLTADSTTTPLIPSSTIISVEPSTTSVLLPPIKVVIDVYDDSTTERSSGVNIAPWGSNLAPQSANGAPTSRY
ncbi:hypothetical protein PRIPAC_77527 [Pristionchus pacificus]|uniref:DUF148 domain-containing protein n=1 Tax=Pristionchus pacificus TaxID=54126 RepID=A0A2A6CNR3_PRIPA|nr:hypothetical protein PRIPAC_77527 [Pristionchus pacificus]|eukprot:PDM79717.1 hypothetical protein PRIPAC_32296 [Pristionchus pacificus]